MLFLFLALALVLMVSAPTLAIEGWGGRLHWLPRTPRSVIETRRMGLL